MFSERLNGLMDSRGIKQVDLCNLTGLSSAQVNHLVSGRTVDPKLPTAQVIASALGVSLDYLAGITDDPTPRRAAAPALAADERELLGDYRTLDPPGRDTARAQVHLLAELQAKSAARASPSSAAGAAEPA